MSNQAKASKEKLMETFKEFKETHNHNLGSYYTPHLVRDFLNTAKPRHIQDFILEMPVINLKETIVCANDDHLKRVVNAIYDNKRLVSRIKKSIAS